MKTTKGTYSAAVAVVLLLSSCGMQRTAQHSDDVYFVPSDEPITAVAPSTTEAPPPAAPNDDYYDANASQQYADPGGYYNMAYNDPYYYNYGRFGFGSGLALQSGWMMNGWGNPVQWGYGTGVYSGWYGGISGFSLGWGNGYGGGWGGWNHPGWGYSPWYNDPWYNGWGYNGWGYGGYGGYGYGNYYGPYGTCACCYTPVIVGGASGVVVAHRPSFGSNAPSVGNTPRRMASFRDPISLSNSERRTVGAATPRTGTSVRTAAPARHGSTVIQRPTERQPSQRPTIDRSRSVERQAPSHRGGFDQGGAAPSRSSGGGSSGGGGRSPGTIRHR